MKKIPVAGPWITEKEIQYVSDAAANGWYERSNEFQTRFEEAFAQKTGTRYAVALPHCTSAIHLALVALGVGKKHEVIVPDLTWIATAAPISYVGATPVFADVDPNTWCISPDSVRQAISPRTKAIISVDLYGGMPEYDELIAICAKNRIALIEDAAEAIGSQYHGKMAGSFGNASVFSFHGSKTLTTGEGGMLLTNDETLYQEALFLRDHGRPPGDKMFLNSRVAFKYRMSAVQAALGLAQVERLDDLVAKKREIFSWYQEELADFPGIRLNTEPANTVNSYWMVTVLWEAGLGISKRKMMELLAERGVDTRPFFSPLSAQKAYVQTEEAKVAAFSNQTAYQVSECGINLPSALCLNKEAVHYVCTQFKSILRTKLKSTENSSELDAQI